jgi:hypothetical protein
MPYRHLRALIAVAALLALAAPAAAQKRVPRIGVVVAVHVNMTPDEAQELGAEVGDALRGALLIDVVAGKQAARRLPPEGVGDMCMARPDCVRDTAARLDVDQILFLVVVKLGNRIQFEPTWTDSEGKSSASRDTLAVEIGKEKVSDVFAAAASRLLPDMPPRPATRTAEQPATADPPPATSGDVVAPPPVRTDTGRMRIHLGTWIAGGVAVAALAGGVGFGLAAKGAESDLKERECGTTNRCESDVDSLEKKMLFADVFYGLAAASAVAAVVIQWRLGRTSEPAITAGPTGDGAAVLLRGRF